MTSLHFAARNFTHIEGIAAVVLGIAIVLGVCLLLYRAGLSVDRPADPAQKPGG